MYVALKTLKKQIDLEFEKKMGFNNVDLFVQELKREEEEKKKAKQRKSEKKAKQKAKKKMQQKENTNAAAGEDDDDDENTNNVSSNASSSTSNKKKKSDNVLKTSIKERNNCIHKNNVVLDPPLFDFSQRLNLIKLYERASPESEDELPSDEAIPLEDIEDYRKNEEVYKRKIKELHSRLEMDWQTICECGGCMPNKMSRKSEE